jgi:signal transduction histidine kinase
MTGYLDGLLKLSQVSGAILQFDTVNLSALVENIASKLKSAHPEHPVELIIHPGLTVKGDPQLLQLALENLLDNAFKFTVGRSQVRIQFGFTVLGAPANIFCEGQRRWVRYAVLR